MNCRQYIACTLNILYSEFLVAADKELANIGNFGWTLLLSLVFSSKLSFGCTFYHIYPKHISRFASIVTINNN